MHLTSRLHLFLFACLITFAFASRATENNEIHQKLEVQVEAMQQALRERKDEIQKCFPTASEVNKQSGASSQSGDLKLKFLIGPKGRVTQITTVEDTLKMPKAGGCIKRIIHSTQFPEPYGGGTTEMIKTFSFKSSSARVKKSGRKS